MLKNKKLMGLLLVCVLLIGLSFYLYSNDMTEYIILTGTFLCVCGVFIFDEAKRAFSSEISLYGDKVDKLLKTYNPILISTTSFPNLKDKSILPIEKINDLFDAQAEVREPIYYIRTADSTAFFIINDDSILISFVKAGNDETELEADFKKAQQLAINLDNIKDIDHTIVVQDKDKSFSISPLHRKKKSAEEKKEEVKEEKVEEKKEEVKEEKKPEKKKKSLKVDEEII